MKRQFSRCFRMLALVLTGSLMVASGWAQINPEFAKDAVGSKDHPLMKRIEGSVIIRYSTKKFDAHEIALERVTFDYEAQKMKARKKLEVEGARTTIFYREPKDVSTLECLRSYQADLKEKGFEPLFEGYSGGKGNSDANQLDDGYGRFVTDVYKSEKDFSVQEYTFPGLDDYRYLAMKKPATDTQGDVYVTIFIGAINETWTDASKGLEVNAIAARVDVLETKAMEMRMVEVKAAEMEKQITTSGRVALYGIYFDTNKATLKPESDAALEEVKKLMTADASIKLLVVGHTDNVGEFEQNRNLSNNRAAAVITALTTRYGISAQRLFPFGCSSASPATSNDTEDGRGKNRRVELVKWN